MAISRGFERPSALSSGARGMIVEMWMFDGDVRFCGPILVNGPGVWRVAAE
jgi:hypothetical protein